MKKKIIFTLLFPLIAASLAGCVKYNGRNKDGSPKDTTTSSGPNTEPPSEPEPVPVVPGTSVTYYLNLGRYGKLNGVKGSKVSEAFLDYGIKVSGASGDALPTKDQVTSELSGVVFEKWLLNGTQTAYDQVPNLDKCVLVACYTTGSGGGGGGGTVVPGRINQSEFPSSGFGLKFSDNTAYNAPYFGPDEYREDSVQYRIQNAQFKKGEIFSIYDFENKAGWSDPLDAYSFGGTPDNLKWKDYLQKQDTTYLVLQDFTASQIYLKMKWQDNIIYFEL